MMTPRNVFIIAVVLSVLGLLWLALLRAAEAQTGGGYLFGRVQPGRVVEVVVVRGMGEDERDWSGDAARSVAVILKTLYAHEYTSGDRIQAQTWDFRTGTARQFTPLVWFVAVLERDGQTRHYTALSCYEVGDLLLYDCWYSYGSQDPAMWWHYNALTIERAQIDSILGALK